MSNVNILWEAQLQDAGLSTKIPVVDTDPDTKAPALAGLTFTPTDVDVSASDQQVTLSLRVIDVGTGASVITVQLDGPGGQQTALCGAGLTGGDAWFGVWTCVATLLTTSLIETVLRDHNPGSLLCGIVAILSEAQLQQAGFPRQDHCDR